MKINVLETICGPDGVLRPGEQEVDEVLAKNLIQCGAALDLNPDPSQVVTRQAVEAIETTVAAPDQNAMIRDQK
jgi:hypothetical protein